MKHYFLGSNTPIGFKGYYNEVNKGGNRLFILKGGSGVGKHTFMKKIASSMENQGQIVDYCHCSNDVNSLDGIVLPGLAIAVIDGTSPHMVDPKIPGAFEETIDLGRYIDESIVIPQRDKIEELSYKKKALYKRAYSYLAAAKILHDDTDSLIKACADEQKLNHMLQSLPKSLISSKNSKYGKALNIFASAYTSSGYVDYIGTLTKGKRTIGIKGHYCINTRMMQELYTYAAYKNADITLCHSITDPSKIDHLLLPEVNIISIDEHNKFTEVDEVIDLKDMVIKDKLMDELTSIQWNNSQFDELIEQATKTMLSCGKYHKELEAIYIPAMNFSKVDEELKKVMEKIHRYIL